MTLTSVEMPECAAASTPALEAERDDDAEIAQLLQPDEIVILVLKPSILFVPLASLTSLLAIALATFFCAWLARSFPSTPWSDRLAIVVGILAGAVRLAWQFLEWWSRIYILTDRRVLRRKGVLRVSVFECRLESLQQTAVYQSLRERIFFLGSICFATAGAAAFVALWEFVARPFEVQRVVAEAIERYGRR